MTHCFSAVRRTLPIFLAVAVAACNDLATGPSAVDGSIDLTLAPHIATVFLGNEIKLAVNVTDGNGAQVADAAVQLRSSNDRIATVDPKGRVIGLAVGTALITGSVVGTNTADTAEVVVREMGDFSPAPVDASEFILGPQVPIGAHPWPWFDDTQAAGAIKWHQAYMEDSPGASNYYDLGVTLYQLHARTGDSQHLKMARDVALNSWLRMPEHSAWPESPSAFAQPPRSTPFGSLILLALEGGESIPELTFYNKHDASWSQTYTLWDWLAGYARSHYPSWLGRRLSNDILWAGVRDGGMLLHGIAMIAKAHPDPAVRAEMTEMALAGARDYYVRLQKEDGSWRWNPGTDSVNIDATQPFMLGLLLEGMIAVHQLTGDADVAKAIVTGTEAIYRDMYDQNEVPFGLLPGVKVRGVFYISYGENCRPVVSAQAGCGNDFEADGGAWKAGNKLKVIRVRNSLVVHAFGYAYQLTGDERFRQWGDDIFGATYGGDFGPGADGHVGLADANKAKEYNQSFRSAGRYLGWRGN